MMNKNANISSLKFVLAKGIESENWEDDIDVVKPKFTLLDFEDILELPEPNFLVEGIIFPNDIGILVAPSASGKTFVALNLAYACATSAKFANRFQVNEQMNVLYACGEGKQQISKRVRVVREQLAYDAGKHGKVATLAEGVPNLCEPGSVTEFIESMQMQDFKPDLVIIDTLHTAIAGFDDSSNRDMGKMFQSVKLIRDTFNCVVLLVHHTGKNGEYRGASALFSNVDFFIEIKGESDVRTMSFEKLKDAEKPIDSKFQLLAKGDSCMVYWLPESITDYKPAQLWYFNNIVDVLASDKNKWYGASEIAKVTRRGKEVSSDNSHLQATKRYLETLEKDGYIVSQNSVSPKNGQGQKLYQYLKDAPSNTAYLGEIEL